MADRPDIGDVREFNNALIEEFRANGGKVAGQFAGANLLLLTTTGARSGQPRVSPLAYFRIDGKLIIIGSFAGSPRDPAWVHNLRANPRARVEVGAETGVQALDVTARELPIADREDVLPKVVAAAPVVAEYQANTSRVIPLFELQPA
ncbi:hypothetical protein MSAS_01060 [Mycobacterium saskatchewanense]|uniref:Deazaflavin-dependent nitroreductase n=1 Tax=Mycobacterium saskatchewanense TaxID=220927 RepID=A0AAJ3TTD8_9MYCO|nr:nitroreductase family deazaflavin-dependent oxidoreductase [Mycobacterium saskatchewanense]ORW67827.1 deazaflavin-dependent nitroreductase [Mycobacterium saskatchewanense]BBX60932.1 hypothetical protein MSAS_01060 [Mycobacterium saskatchewanense]